MFLTSRFLWLNLLLKNIVMTKRTSWFLSVAAIVIILMGGGYAALRHSRTQVHALINQSLQEAERLHYNDRLNAFSRNPRIYVDPALKAYLFAPVSSRKIKSYTLQTTEGKTTYLFKDSIPEEKARKLLNEYLLADIQPVRVEEVNRLFQEQLEKGMSAERRVCFIPTSRPAPAHGQASYPRPLPIRLRSARST